jgi:hypothetical protein
MPQKPTSFHPTNLEIGKIYLRKNGGQPDPELLPVQFVEYSACPAIVIIFESGRRKRCPRADLYLLKEV